jgi:glyoxylase I family protein
VDGLSAARGVPAETKITHRAMKRLTESTAQSPRASSPRTGDGRDEPAFAWQGVRYQVTEVARSVAFYTQALGFTLEHQHPPQFASVSLGALRLLLSGPGASGSRGLPDGQHQAPGGWNRVVLGVKDLPSCIARLRQIGLRFRNEMEVGPAGRQIQIEDPDGNPIELLESVRRDCESC